MEVNPVQYMLTWSIPPANHEPAFRSFMKTGGPAPDGATMVGRWHVPGSTHGWVLLETDDVTTVAEHVAEWAGLLEIDVHAVVGDAEAADAATRVYS